jgi:hypothetical protein
MNPTCTSSQPVTMYMIGHTTNGTAAPVRPAIHDV